MSTENEVKISYEPIPIKDEHPLPDSVPFSPRGKNETNFDDIHVFFLLFSNQQSFSEVQGYKISTPGLIFFVILCVLSLGTFALISYWWPIIYLKLTHFKADLDTCEVVYVIPTSSQETGTILSVTEISLKSEKLRFFCYRKINFIYKQAKKVFIKAE